MKKSKRPKASKREDGFDFISNMPDAILLLILSRLVSTEEAIRSSILSRRWRFLWTAIPSLDIDLPCRQNFKKSEFKEFVYWVLASKTVDLDSFRLYCENLYSMSTVGRWIHMAVTRNVKQLNLTFCPKEKTEAVELPHCLVTCRSLEVLRLEWVISPGLCLPKFKGFPALRVLALTWVDLLDDRVLVKDFLESCPSLEDLSLFNCELHKLDLLCISCQKLKRLSINCEHMGCCDIKISCPKLVDFELTGYMTCNVFFDRLDSLKKVVYDPLSRSSIVPLLFHGNSHVKPLWMDLYFLSECFQTACDLVLPNLKTLVLKTTMDAFSFNELIRVLKNSPKLESLELTIRKEFCGPDLDEWELHGGGPREIMSPDVKEVDFFELNGEKPKLVLDWPRYAHGLLEMVFSWGVNLKASYSHSHWCL